MHNSAQLVTLAARLAVREKLAQRQREKLAYTGIPFAALDAVRQRRAMDRKHQFGKWITTPPAELMEGTMRERAEANGQSYRPSASGGSSALVNTLIGAGIGGLGGLGAGYAMGAQSPWEYLGYGAGGAGLGAGAGYLSS